MIIRQFTLPLFGSRNCYFPVVSECQCYWREGKPAAGVPNYTERVPPAGS